MHKTQRKTENNEQIHLKLALKKPVNKTQRKTENNEQIHLKLALKRLWLRLKERQKTTHKYT